MAAGSGKQWRAGEVTAAREGREMGRGMGAAEGRRQGEVLDQRWWRGRGDGILSRDPLAVY
jgi:hypothetical protein